MDETLIEPEVVFNMDLANGPTGERFCREACDVMGLLVDDSYFTDDDEESFLGEYIDWLDDQLSMRGYHAHWDAGDVVVYDLRPLSDDERDAFFEQLA
jgi:hypothetical protein